MGALSPKSHMEKELGQHRSNSSLVSKAQWKEEAPNLSRDSAYFLPRGLEAWQPSVASSPILSSGVGLLLSSHDRWLFGPPEGSPAVTGLSTANRSHSLSSPPLQNFSWLRNLQGTRYALNQPRAPHSLPMYGNHLFWKPKQSGHIT